MEIKSDSVAMLLVVAIGCLFVFASIEVVMLVAAVSSVVFWLLPERKKEEA